MKKNPKNGAFKLTVTRILEYDWNLEGVFSFAFRRACRRELVVPSLIAPPPPPHPATGSPNHRFPQHSSSSFSSLFALFSTFFFPFSSSPSRIYSFAPVLHLRNSLPVYMPQLRGLMIDIYPSLSLLIRVIRVLKTRVNRLFFWKKSTIFFFFVWHPRRILVCK